MCPHCHTRSGWICSSVSTLGAKPERVMSARTAARAGNMRASRPSFISSWALGCMPARCCAPPSSEISSEPAGIGSVTTRRAGAASGTGLPSMSVKAVGAGRTAGGNRTSAANAALRRNRIAMGNEGNGRRRMARWYHYK